MLKGCKTKLITVLCPTYNEAENVEEIIRFFIQSKPDNKELILVDGGSTDGTIEIIQRWSNNYNNIVLLQNPNKYVPFALNIGIKNSSGDPIIRIDAHTRYANNYIEKILETFKLTNADVVGGPFRIEFKTILQEATAYVIKNSFGIGNSIVQNTNFEGWVDGVAYGAWKREIFSEIGYFDERLLRNQDDEMCYRCVKNGKKIYLNPGIKLWYQPRKSFLALSKQYLHYGIYKPLVLSKLKSLLKLRHLIPAIFVLYIILLFIFHTGIFLIPLILYLFIILTVSLNNTKNIKVKLSIFSVFPTIHISYGVGFLLGTFFLGKLKKGEKVFNL